MARNYAALPHEYLQEMEILTDAEFGRLCRALLRYSSTGEVTNLRGRIRIVFQRVKMQEDRFQASYDAICKKRSEAGKRGAEKRWQVLRETGREGNCQIDDGKPGKTKSQTKTETEPQSTQFAGGSSARPFVPPTLQQVQDYVAERHSPVDPQQFMDFYAAKGWIVGKSPMKDWKAACRNAEKWDRWAKPEAKRGSWARLAAEMDQEDGV